LLYVYVSYVAFITRCHRRKVFSILIVILSILLIVGIIVAIIMAVNVKAVYFQLENANPKCIFEELPKHDVVLVNTNLMDEFAPMRVYVLDP